MALDQFDSESLPQWNEMTHNPNPGPYLAADGTRVVRRCVLRSYAGYYIGRLCDEGPYSRESVEYFPTEDQAEAALAQNAFTFRPHP